MNVNALKAEIARSGLTQASVAKSIGMSESTFWRRLQTKNFGLNEAEALIKLLNIKNPEEVFLTED